MDTNVVELLTDIRNLLQQLVDRNEKPTTTEYLSVEQASQFSGLAVSTVRRLVRLGTLPAVNIGAGPQRPTWRIRWTDLEDYLGGRNRVSESRHFGPKKR
jgi:excisionase family DNA binding protein